MPRYGWRRRWVKLYVTGWLHGSIRWQFTSEERGVWADLIALAGEIQQNGKICDNDGRSLPRSFIANQLNIKQTLLDQVIAKCLHEGRLAIDDNEVLSLTNYDTYQSEYERQKKYRDKLDSNENDYTQDDQTESLAKIFKAYEAEIGLITPAIAEELKDIADTYPEGWFEKAVTEASKHNKRNLSYIKAILKRWKAEGMSDTKQPEQPTIDRTKTHIDPETGIKVNM